MNIQIFVCFHKQIFPELYEISKIEQDNYLTYYGVKDNYEDTTRNIIYEYNLAHYTANLQKKNITREVAYIMFIKIIYIINIIT